MFFINLIYWLWIFIIPSGILCFIGYWIYAKDSSNIALSIILSIIGILSGIFFAEKVRKKHGLSNFFSRISATPDINDSNILDKESEEEKRNLLNLINQSLLSGRTTKVFATTSGGRKYNQLNIAIFL